MKISHIVSFLGGVAITVGLMTTATSNAQSSNHVYELRIYPVNPGKMEGVKSRFGDHSDAILKRHGMKDIGYWVAQDTPQLKNRFVYIVEHASRQQADKNWAAFVADPEWPKVKAASEVNGQLVDEKNITSIFMDPT